MYLSKPLLMQLLWGPGETPTAAVEYVYLGNICFCSCCIYVAVCTPTVAAVVYTCTWVTYAFTAVVYM